MDLATLIGQDTIEKIRGVPLTPAVVQEFEKLSFDDIAQNKRIYHMCIMQRVYWPLVHNGLKLFNVPPDVTELIKSTRLTFGEFRLPYDPLIVKLPDDPRYLGLIRNGWGIVAVIWEPPGNDTNFAVIEVNKPDDCLADDPAENAQLLYRAWTAATICYHSGQLLEKLPTTGKTRRARAINQGHQIKLVQTVDWIRQNYVKRSEPTGQTKAPHERKAHSRCVQGRLIDVKACVIHKDRYQKPVTTVIQ